MLLDNTPVDIDDVEYALTRKEVAKATKRVRSRKPEIDQQVDWIVDYWREHGEWPLGKIIAHEFGVSTTTAYRRRKEAKERVK